MRTVANLQKIPIRDEKNFKKSIDFHPAFSYQQQPVSRRYRPLEIESMKSKVTLGAALVVALTTFGTPTTSALTESQVKAIQTAFNNVPRPELPARAAALVAKADEKEQQKTAVEAVKAIVAKFPSSAPALIGAIAKAAPEVASAAAATAVELAPHEALAIARAAASAAPTRAGQIAASVAKVRPKAAVNIAVTIINAVPAAGPEIVDSVAVAVPESKARLPRVTGAAAVHGGRHGEVSTLPGLIVGDTPASGPVAVYASPGLDPDRLD